MLAEQASDRASGAGPGTARFVVDLVWRDGQWGPRRKLAWDDPRGAYIYTNNCGQRVVLPDGDILLAFSFGSTPAQPRSVAGVLCSFDGETLLVRSVGKPLTNPVPLSIWP